MQRENSSFNEAGADAPEIQAWVCERREGNAGFNEAGADAPEIHDPVTRRNIAGGASMRPGRMPRKYYIYLLTAWRQ